ncbi:MAG TPA: hypothetical protein VJ957_08995, partial [Longimicrobiales bacterium]|nr:hypothetical protein [Longimicrobiales bacterium]
MRMRLLMASIAIPFLVVGPLSAQRPSRGMPPQGGNASSQEKQGVPAVEKVSTTHHKVTIDGKEIAYTANTGTMVLRDDDGNPAATVFYIAYTKDGQDAGKRPVTFFFNGGPGSASIWLDMGIMAPRHPNMGPHGTEPSPPYALVDNPYSPLGATDLVQVDAMMTGYSRPGPGVKASDYTGANNDIAMFAQFIRDYLDKYDRWSSPKYLFGESYGTFRSAGLASYLQEREGIELNGIMLLGTVLDFQYIMQSPSNDIGYSTFLPTYTATAWYHKKLPADLQNESLEQVVQQSRDFAFGDYMTALAKGNELPQSEREAVAQKLARLTGVSEKFILQTNLRISAGVYRTELLRDERETVGRYDSRLIGINGNASSQREDYDPSDVAPSGAFMSAFMQYLHNELNYKSDLQYYMGGHTGRWDYTGAGYGFPNEMESLRLAMA